VRRGRDDTEEVVRPIEPKIEIWNWKAECRDRVLGEG